MTAGIWQESGWQDLQVHARNIRSRVLVVGPICEVVILHGWPVVVCPFFLGNLVMSCIKWYHFRMFEWQACG